MFFLFKIYFRHGVHILVALRSDRNNADDVDANSDLQTEDSRNLQSVSEPTNNATPGVEHRGRSSEDRGEYIPTDWDNTANQEEVERSETYV